MQWNNKLFLIRTVIKAVLDLDWLTDNQNLVCCLGTIFTPLSHHSRFKTEHETVFHGIIFAISKRLNNANSLPRVLHSLAFKQMRKVIPVVYDGYYRVLYRPPPPSGSLYLLCRQDRFLWNVFFGIWFWAKVPSLRPSLKAVVSLTSDVGLGEGSPQVSAGGAATILTQGLCVCLRTCLCGEWDDAQQLESVLALREPSSAEVLSSLLFQFVFFMKKSWSSNSPLMLW